MTVTGSPRNVKTSDPFTNEIIRNYLISTVREMYQATIRAAYSTDFSEGEDFTCALFDRAGRMVAQAYGIPGQPGALVDPMQVILETYDDLQEGDVVVLNDPYRGGSHQADVVICRPVVVAGNVFGFAINAGHWIDIGGMAPGGWSGTATDVVQEGLIIPPVRLYRRGELVREIRDFILSNVRLQSQVWGDLQAQIASNVVAERRVRELVAQYGRETIEAGMEAALEYSNRRFRRGLAEVPDGVFRAEDYLEDDGRGGGPFTIRVTVTKSGDHVEVDFAGTDSQAYGPVNVSFTFTRSAAICALLAIVDPDVPVNSGILSAIEVRAPVGSLVHPTRPAPVFCGSSDPRTRVAEVVIRALADARPDRVAAGSYGTGNDVTGSGIDPETGSAFLWYIFESGGCGARSDSDGNSAEWHIIGNCRNESMEVWETRFPVRFERYELIPDSGGPGRYRGGLGVRRSLRLLADTTISGYADRHRIPPWGLAGGLDGTPNRFIVTRDGADTTIDQLFGVKSGSKFSNVELRAGDVLTVVQGGGGGYGDPAQRDPELLKADIRAGYVTKWPGANSRSSDRRL